MSLLPWISCTLIHPQLIPVPHPHSCLLIMIHSLLTSIEWKLMSSWLTRLKIRSIIGELLTNLSATAPKLRLATRLLKSFMLIVSIIGKVNPISSFRILLNGITRWLKPCPILIWIVFAHLPMHGFYAWCMFASYSALPSLLHLVMILRCFVPRVLPLTLVLSCVFNSWNLSTIRPRMQVFPLLLGEMRLLCWHCWTRWICHDLKDFDWWH